MPLFLDDACNLLQAYPCYTYAVYEINNLFIILNYFIDFYTQYAYVYTKHSFSNFF